MDKPDKNIEDFFNKSLEQFSEAPSDKVWANIAYKLEEDKPPFYKKWKFWLTSFFTIGVLFLLSWGYYSTQKAIDLLTIQTSQLVTENQQLKLALTDCSAVAQRTTLNEEKKPSSENLNKENNKKVLKITDNQSVGKKKDKGKSVFTNMALGTTIKLAFSKLDNKQGSINENTPNLDTDLRLREGLLLSTFDKKSRTDLKERAIEKRLENLNLEAEVATAKASGFHQLKKLNNRALNTRRVKTPFRRKLPNSFIDYVPFNLTQPLAKKIDYRFGYSFGGMNTWTDQKDLFGPGYNSGITSELGSFKGLYLTLGLQFNEQHYEVKLNANNQEVLQSYPAVDELTSVVTSINQHAHYLDLPIGLKWYSKENAKGAKFYVNPAVAWLFYFPQKFKYEQATNNGITVTEHTNHQFFGYLGTAQLQIGMEKRLFKKMNYQIGLWAEKSLIPIGVENRHLLNTGIRGAIMFN